MNKSRLSLSRRDNEVQGTHYDIVEISDDDEFDHHLPIQKSTKECGNVMSPESTGVSSNIIECNSEHDTSADLSDGDVADDVPSNVFNQSQSMFNWSKQPFVTKPPYQNIFPECSGSSKMSTESPNKRQKLVNTVTIDSSSLDSSFSDDESISLDTHKEDDLLPKVGIQYSLMIAGVKVNFPVKPYPCQIAVMNSLIQGCTKEQNCLLESPTGSGKTLALLCGALAFQEQYREKMYQEKSDGMNAESSFCDEDDPFNENFFFTSSQYFNEELHDKLSRTADKIPKKIPKIYYGTRTHKQIEQVVRELKKTAYRHKRMTILSSRNNTCLQKTEKNKDELCNELLDPLKTKKCPYYNDSKDKRNSRKDMTVFNNMQTPWDIEDLVSLGEKYQTCPYFGARSLMANADIIFCPYNYILNPDIRESVQISLRDNIVILDEAHNVEDICRETASINLRDDEIQNAIMECQYLYKYYNHDNVYDYPNNLEVDGAPNKKNNQKKKHGRDYTFYNTLQKYLTDIVKFLKYIEVHDNESAFDNQMISKTWLGTELRMLLDANNVGCSRFPTFITASMRAVEDFVQNKEETHPERIRPTISRDTKRHLEHLCFIMQMITLDTCVNDYRMYVVETYEFPKHTTENSSKKVKIRTMKLICMNPAITFAPLARTVRSVVVTSGTLTPTASFQSELGTQFPHIVNPNHIIPKDQVYARCIPHGPKGVLLKATYDNINSWQFQDELGNLMLQVCDAVPYGVLCFFSSYHAMNTIHQRWKNNGIWDKLLDLKRIFLEPKESKQFPEVREKYRSVIEESSSKSYRDACGAILFAVYRGKVAEGMNFSDNEARCVLAIGIPYLPKSNDVDMKMKYNDSSISKGLLPGSEWYTINAFRAVNQAIGRCVRHKGDWGAVLLIDGRYQPYRMSTINKQSSYYNSYVDYLPKWIKTNLKLGNDYNLEIELQDFVAIQTAREKEEKEKLTEN